MSIEQKDKIIGCFLGLSIGDCLGSIVNGLSPYEIMSKYATPINSYYEDSIYTGETVSCIVVAQEIIKNIPNISSEILINATNRIKAKVEVGPPQLVFSKIIPISLFVTLQEKDDQFLIPANKTLSSGLKKSENLAIFVLTKILSELLQHPAEYQKPSELYDADSSLLSRMVKLTIEIESKWGLEDLEHRVSDRLDFVRKKLMKHQELPWFVGINDNRNIHESLANILFAYMSAPDDISTIYKLISMGKIASVNGAIVGALIGTTIGADALPIDLKDNLPKNRSGEIRALASDFYEKCKKE